MLRQLWCQDRKDHPDDEITTMDLYLEDIHLITSEDINTIFGPKSGTETNHPLLMYTYQFVSMDKFVIAAPMWNLSIPSILKAYIDYICVPEITFKYTAEGPVGLCSGKKALHIMATGGEYSQGPSAEYEMGDRYLRTIFGFLGITDFSTITAERLDIQGENVDAIVNDAIQRALQEAKTF